VDVRSHYDIAYELVKMIADQNKLVIGHNLSYDYRVIKQDFGITLENLFDTMIAAQILECGLPTKRGHFTLEKTAQRYYDPFAYTNQGNLFIPYVTKKVRDSFALIEDDEEFSEVHLTYGALDVVYAYGLYVHLQRLLRENDLHDLARLEFETIKVLTDMSINGIPINKDAWLKVAEQSKAAAEELLKELKLVADINWLSWQQVSKVFKTKGINVEFIDRKTGTIKESVSKVALASKMSDPLVKTYIDYREAVKRDGTYGESFLQHVNPRTGRIHSSFWQIKDTGRTSSSDPNMQNIPHGEEYRSAFEAPKG